MASSARCTRARYETNDDAAKNTVVSTSHKRPKNRLQSESTMEGFASLMHPVTFVYALSFASMFAWPAMVPREVGEPCRDISTDWFNLAASVFANAIAHSIYCLWLIERVVHHYSKGRAPGGAMLSMGEALSRGGSLGSWGAYFGFRVAIPAAVTLVLFAAEHECTLRYEQLLGSMLFADATFTFFMFAASWSGERMSKDSATIKETKKETNIGKKGEKKDPQEEGDLAGEKKTD